MKEPAEEIRNPHSYGRIRTVQERADLEREHREKINGKLFKRACDEFFRGRGMDEEGPASWARWDEEWVEDNCGG